MCALDIILTLCLALAAVRGAVKGLTVQVIALVSLVVGVWAAFRFSGLVCSLVQPYLQANGKVLHVIVFVLMIILIAAGFRLIGKVIKASIRFITLDWLDKLLGAVFSVVKVGLVIGILLLLFSAVNTEYNFVSSESLAKSGLYEPMKNMTCSIFPYFKELLHG